MSAYLRFLASLLVLASTQIIGGCATYGGGIEPLGELPPARLPDYRVGDRVVYDNGHMEEVVAIDGGKVRWRRDSGTEFSLERNFVLPYADRLTGFKISRWETEVSVDDLWPLRAGENRLAYRTRRYDELLVVDSSATPQQVPKPQDLACKSMGTARVRVVAGVFDTYKIACSRFRMARGWQPYHEWYYAPSVGHYVLRIDYSSRGGFRRRLEMVAFLPALPPASARLSESADQHLQQVLSSTPSGTKVVFKPAGKSNIRISTTPLNTLRNSDGTYCRNFQQELSSGGTSRMQVGVACFEADAWRIPGI